MRAPAYLSIGNVLTRLGRWEEAAESYWQAINADPRFADAYNNLGIALSRMGREHGAIAAHAQAIEINPFHANAYFNLGKLSAKFNEFATASALLEKAIAIQPMHAYAYLELGVLQQKAGLLEKAASSYRRSMELDPTRTARGNLAGVLALMGNSEGIDRLEQLVREQPLDAESHWNLGIGLLLHRRYEEGWREFEWRTEIPRFYKLHHRYRKPQWRGEPLQGTTILLFGEQGHGDTLQFLRYVPFVTGRGGRVVLDVPPLLCRLLQEFPGVSECVALGDPKPDFSTYASLMSLPHLLGARAIPPPVAPAVQDATVFRERGTAGSAPSRLLQVGLAWAGAASHQRDRLRSIPLAEWNSLAQIEGVAFTALQMGPPNAGAGSTGHRFHFVEDCAGLADFAALAAVLAKLDLIITVDTAVAHLAGMMGKPVWILLSNAVDWRWGLHSASTEWYPTARLFRQTTPADWKSVMADVGYELQKRARQTAPQKTMLEALVDSP